MTWSIEQLAFVIYNNRTVEGVVSNFMPQQLDPSNLIELEKKLQWSKFFYEKNQRFLEIEKSKLDLEAPDITVTLQDVNNLTNQVQNAYTNLNGFELDYLISRGITKEIIDEYKIGGLSNITNYNDLITLNATCHPLLKPILEDGLEGGGIIIPLFKDGLLINCAIRKISDIGKLKYSLACPDIPVWGLDDIHQGDEVWMCEGLFDMMALRSIGLKAVSCSSAMWPSIQLYFLLDKKPGSINILCDNDQVGLKTGKILSRFFNLYLIRNKTFHCKSSKDAAESIFEKKLLDDIQEINITNDMILKQDDSFNFLKYLENRKF